MHSRLIQCGLNSRLVLVAVNIVHFPVLSHLTLNLVRNRPKYISIQIVSELLMSVYLCIKYLYFK